MKYKCSTTVCSKKVFNNCQKLNINAFEDNNFSTKVNVIIKAIDKTEAIKIAKTKFENYCKALKFHRFDNEFIFNNEITIQEIDY